jgi:hypothetical protein
MHNFFSNFVVLPTLRGLKIEVFLNVDLMVS